MASQSLDLQTRIRNFSTRLARGGKGTAKSSNQLLAEKKERKGCVCRARENSNILNQKCGEAAQNCQPILLGTPNDRNTRNLNSILNYFQPTAPRPVQPPPANLGEIQLRHLNNQKCDASMAMFNSECESLKYFIAFGNEPHASKGNEILQVFAFRVKHSHGGITLLVV